MANYLSGADANRLAAMAGAAWNSLAAGARQNMGKPLRDTNWGSLATVPNPAPPAGSNNDAAAWLGAPVDAMSWLMRKAGIPTGSQPAYGSNQIRNWLAQLPASSQVQARLQHPLDYFPPYQAYLRATGQPGAYQQYQGGR
jgi:hypothetical protein